MDGLMAGMVTMAIRKALKKKQAKTKQEIDTYARDDDFEEEDLTEDESDLQVIETDFDGLVVAPSDWTLDSLSRQIGKQINLNPEFQRRGVWSARAKSRFIESLFLNIPIPQVLLATRQEEKNSFIVLDGKQRLLAIQQFMDGKHDDGKKFELNDLKRLDELNGKSWLEISKMPGWKDRFQNQTLRTAVLRGWKKEDVLFEIFERLNSGSVKLSPMELRMSLHGGEFLKYLIKWSEEPRNLHRLLRLKRPDRRMADAELTLRFIAFKRNGADYPGNLKEFLDGTTDDLNKQFAAKATREGIFADVEEMEAAIGAALEIFGPYACRKWKEGDFDSRFNRAVFDVQIGSLSSNSTRRWALKHRAAFRKAFVDLCKTNREFLASLETTTKSKEAVNRRFTDWYRKLRKVSGLKIAPFPMKYIDG